MSYLDDILKVTQAYQAEYLATPISLKPGDGCTITLSPLPGPMPPVVFPGDTKPCSPLFIPLPLIPAPFPPIENCPDGIRISGSLSILNNINDTTPSTINVSTSGTDICNLGINVPPLVIPCYPNGISMGTITFNDHTGNNPVAVLDLSNTGPVINPDTPCTWNNTSIDLPIVNCAAGMTFGTDINVTLSSGGNPISTSAGSGAYQTLTFSPSTTPNDCGYTLTGDLNLALPPFVSKCPNGLKVSTNASVVASYKVQSVTPNTNGTWNPPTTTNTPTTLVTLSPDTCGFGFGSPLVTLPFVACTSDSFTPVQPNITQGDTFNNSLSFTPSYCGLSITGSLTIPISGGGGSAGPGSGPSNSNLSTTPFSPNNTYNTGGTTSVVFPFGSKCIYNYTGQGTSSSNRTVPGTPTGDGSFDCISCTGPKEFLPFKVIRSNQTESARDASGNLDSSSFQKLVKVTPRSFIHYSVSGVYQIMPVTGLDIPFVLPKGNKVWVEVLMNVDSSGALSPVYAALATGTAWDSDASPVPGVGTNVFKLLNSANASAILKSIAQAQKSKINSYIDNTTSHYVGLTDAQISDLVSKQVVVLNNIKNLNTTNNVQFKLYILVAAAFPTSKPGADNSGDVVLCENGVKAAQLTPVVTPIVNGTGGSISSITVGSPGYNYTNPTLVLSPGVANWTGTAAISTVTTDPTTGAITNISLTNSGSGYPKPTTAYLTNSVSAKYYEVSQILRNNQLLTGFNFNGTPVLQNIDYPGQGYTLGALPALTMTITKLNPSSPPTSPVNYALTFSFVPNPSSPSTAPSLSYAPFTSMSTASNNSGFTLYNPINVDVQTPDNFDDPSTAKVNIYVTSDGSQPTINSVENPNSQCLNNFYDYKNGTVITKDIGTPVYYITVNSTSSTYNPNNTLKAFAVCGMAEPSPIYEFSLASIVSNSPPS